MPTSTSEPARAPRRFGRRAGLLVPALVAACRPAQIPPAGSPHGQVTLVIAGTTDVHGRLRAHDYYQNAPEPGRGLTRVATIFDSLRAAHPGRVILVDAGDLLQGNPLTYVAARSPAGPTHPVIDAMNAAGYDAMAIGNHEFNYGLPMLERALAGARFAVLAANAYSVDGRPAFRRWAMVERGGVRVGIVGATTPGSMVWDREHLRGRLVIRDILPEVRTAVAEARAAGADVILAVLHSGLGEPASYDTASTGLPGENVSARVAREVPGLDVIIYGHSHREMADTVIGGVLLMQPRNWATSAAVAELHLERRAGRWQITSKRGRLISASGHVEHPAVLAATEVAHRAAVAYVAETLGTTGVAWRADSARVKDTPIVDLILEVQRRRAGADLASTAAFNLRASLDTGAITVAEVAALYPYDNTLRAIRVSGRQVREYVERSAHYFVRASDGRAAVDTTIPGYNYDMLAGIDYAIDLRRPAGFRITGLSVRGRPVTDTDTFTLALNNYRQTGGGGFSMLASAPVVFESREDIRELLIDEVRRRKTLRPEDYFRLNWRLEPPSAVDEAYRAMTGYRQ
ncbi:MAG: 5'-nucleotidase C-terminal domain-containing protein [Gemmatimonadota bacterium]|nr:5'-nucleotidase C-terminal domain-containing protein [Gemmatimonadota bacterium]